MRMLLVLLALAACQSAAPPKPAIANTSDKPPPPPPYILANACTDSMPHACDVRECMAFKLKQGGREDVAFGECLQDCNCGE